MELFRPGPVLFRVCDDVRGEAPTIIIGAGPAGLAVGAALGRKGLPFETLERDRCVAASWHRHYERLHLHTPKQHSALPFVAFPKAAPRYPSRDQVIDYLDGYARTFGLRPHFGVDVRGCARDGDGNWELQTDAGPSRSRCLVVATGYSRIPRLPSWRGLDVFGGPVLHSSEYTNGARFRGMRVLVVGSATPARRSRSTCSNTAPRLRSPYVAPSM